MATATTAAFSVWRPARLFFGRVEIDGWGQEGRDQRQGGIAQGEQSEAWPPAVEEEPPSPPSENLRRVADSSPAVEA